MGYLPHPALALLLLALVTLFIGTFRPSPPTPPGRADSTLAWLRLRRLAARLDRSRRARLDRAAS